jgi:hypothetical protein
LFAKAPSPSFAERKAMEIIPVNQIDARPVMSATAAGDPLGTIETAYRRIEAERDRNCWKRRRPSDVYAGR